MAFSNKLYQEINKLQKESGYDFMLHGNGKGETFVLIAVNFDKVDSTHPEALIKTATIDFAQGKLIYTTTTNINEALKFSDTMSTMLYHYIQRMAPEIKDHTHYSILNNN